MSDVVISLLFPSALHFRHLTNFAITAQIV